MCIQTPAANFINASTTSVRRWIQGLQNNHQPQIVLSSHMKETDEGMQVKIMLESSE